MKRRIILSVALAAGFVLLSLMRSDPTRAQPAEMFAADTGVVELGADQALRVTADWDGDGNDTIPVRFRRMEYEQGGCNGGVCHLAVSSQNTSAPMTLMPGEALSVAVDPSNPSNTYARVVVFSNNRNTRVTATIINTATGEVVALMSTSEIDTW